MAVTTENSTEYAARLLASYSLQEMLNAGAKLRVQKITFTQGAAAGDANSLVNLWKTPPGKVNIITGLSFLICSAFGVGRTLDIGHTAYTDNNGDSVAADADSLADGLDIAAAGKDFFDLTPGVVQFNSQEGVVIQAICLGDTIPAAATLKGLIFYTMGD